MSADDKKSTILNIFHQSKRPYTLKEIEKLASKAGVVQNTVKDILKDLTDEVSFSFRFSVSRKELEGS